MKTTQTILDEIKNWHQEMEKDNGICAGTDIEKTVNYSKKLVEALEAAITSLKIINSGCTEKGFRNQVDVEESTIGLDQIQKILAGEEK